MRFVAAVVALAGCSFAPGIARSIDPDAPTIDASAIDAEIDGAVVLGPTCSDGITNGDETDMDCGGSCSQCAIGMQCIASTDCAAGICDLTACRHPVSCDELHTAQLLVLDGPVSLDSGSGVYTTYCDMTTDGGGWTLIGKVDGRYEMYSSWLISSVNPSAMTTPTIGTASYACIDALALAVAHSTEVRFSNSAITHWVKWPLPVGRAVGTFWHHTVGYTTINGATQASVVATSSEGATTTCYQNVYGIMNYSGHGGPYPATGKNVTGNTTGNDMCMAIGTMTSAGTVDGFTSNSNGFDAPIDETGWPNTNYNVTPHVAVWLR